MENSKMVKNILAKIEANKEILATMPQNTQKNRERYISRIQELLDEYEKYRADIEDILIQRYKRNIGVRENKKIDVINERLKTIDELLVLLCDQKNSYEKMELDKNIYKLSKYYRENLESVNNQIEKCIVSFEKVGICLSADEFNYSIYVKEYMRMFLNEYRNLGDINSKEMKAKFDDIYWKCPEIIMQIELNLRTLYLINEEEIDKFFDAKVDEILLRWQKAPQSIMKNYLNLKEEKDKIELFDKKTLLNNFIDGKFIPKNLTDAKIIDLCSQILPQEYASKIFESKEVQDNIFQFLNSLYEFKNYMEFKFIVDDVRKLYENKQSYKKSYDDIKKKIQKDNKRLKKINSKINRKNLCFIKFDNTKNIEEQSKILQEMKNDYKELNLNEFYQKMSEVIKDNSTIFDVLSLASSYYNFLIKCLIDKNNDITQDEMDEEIDKLHDFVTSPYNTIINNIRFLDDKRIDFIIKDRYKLMNFNIMKEDITTENVDSLIRLLESIRDGICVHEAGINIEDVEELLEIKKLFKL